MLSENEKDIARDCFKKFKAGECGLTYLNALICTKQNCDVSRTYKELLRLIEVNENEEIIEMNNILNSFISLSKIELKTNK